MSELASIVGIAAALGIGAISPGPSFVMIARTAASAGRVNGLNAAIGMGLGALIFGVASLLGLNALFLAVPVLYLSLKFFGGLYLAYLGFCIWRGAKQPLKVSPEVTLAHSSSRQDYLLLGLATQVSNPKTAIVYASVFAAFLPASPSIQYNFAVVTLVFIIEAGWYAIIAVALSSEAPRNAYLRFKKWVDRVAGGVLGTLGLKLVASTGQH